MRSVDPDADLMPRIADGDAEAYRMLAQRHLDPVHRFAVRLLGDRAAAEDVVQDTFLRVWNRAGGWRPTSTVGAWIFRIARNRCLDLLRARRPQTDVTEMEIPDAPKAPRIVADGERARSVNDALATLPDRQRMAVVLTYFEELTGPEAAEAMGLSADAFESLLRRARRALKSHLADQRDALMGEEP